MRKRRSVTIAAIEHSQKICDDLSEDIPRIEVRLILVNTFRKGFDLCRRQNMKRMIDAVDITPAIIDPEFPDEFKPYFEKILSHIKTKLFHNY